MKADGGRRSRVHCGPTGEPLTRSPLTTARSPRDSEVVQSPVESEKKEGEEEEEEEQEEEEEELEHN